MRELTLGSLFSGSGGFELAGVLNGIKPVFCSEIEPYPIAVTKSRFPELKHLGDVSKVSGYDIEPVDIITFGSPCQDLSVAGNRAGMKHEGKGDDETTRSGLFMEAIRIIKEMRDATRMGADGIKPRWAVWENVPGAFSSGKPKGEDFRIVLEEFVKIKEPSAEMPAMDRGGWPYADVILGDGWSVAYRTFDLQYWRIPGQRGCPQRRRRIYLVADFGSERAGEVLFIRQGLQGHSSQSREKGQGITADAEEGFGATD